MAKQYILTLDDDRASALEREAAEKEKEPAVLAASIIANAADKFGGKEPKANKSDTTSKPPPKPQIRPELAATLHKRGVALWVQGELQTASDRAAGVLGGAFVDDSLAGLLKTCCQKWWSPPNATPLMGSVFEYPNPMSSFSARIVVARASGVIGPQTYADLENIRRIRNACAHWTMSESEKFVPVSFKEADIKLWCSGLTFAAGLEEEFVGEHSDEPMDPRDKFILTVSLLGEQLVNCDIGIVDGRLTATDVAEFLP